MDGLNGIPEKDFEKLSKYLGREKALEYIKKEKYNYQAVSTKLLLLDIKEYSKRKPIAFWFVAVLLIVFLSLYIFDIVHF